MAAALSSKCAFPGRVEVRPRSPRRTPRFVRSTIFAAKDLKSVVEKRLPGETNLTPDFRLLTESRLWTPDSRLIHSLRHRDGLASGNTPFVKLVSFVHVPLACGASPGPCDRGWNLLDHRRSRRAAE